MGIVVKQGVKNTVYNYIGFILGYVNTLLLFPNYFSQEQFGLVQTIIAITVILSQFSMLGFNTAIIRYLPFFVSDLKRKASFIGLSMTIPFLGMLVICALVLLLKEHVLGYYEEDRELLNQFYHQLLPIFISVGFFELLSAISRSQLKSVVPIVMNAVVKRVLVMGIILLFAFEWVAFDQFIWLFTLVHIALSFLLLGYLVYLGKWSFSFRPTNLKRMEKKAIFSFSGFNFFTQLSNTILTRIDVIMIGAMIDLKAAAMYTIPLFIANVVQVPTRSLIGILSPWIAKHMKKKNYEEIAKVYKLSSINQLLVGGMIFVLILVNLEVLSRFIPDNYGSLLEVFTFIGLGYLVGMFFGANGHIISNSKYYRFNLYISAGLVVAVILTNLFAIPRFGIVGAAGATATSLALFNLAKFLLIKAKWNITPFTIRTIKALLLIVGILLVGLFLPDTKWWFVNLGYHSTIMMGLFIIAIYNFKFSEELKDILNSALSFLKIKS